MWRTIGYLFYWITIYGSQYTAHTIVDHLQQHNYIKAVDGIIILIVLLTLVVTTTAMWSIDFVQALRKRDGN